MSLKAVVLLLVVCTTVQEIFTASLCSECVCPAEYNPICAKQQETGKLRGFSNMCVMNCNNMCAKNKYEFYKKGRCGTGSKRVTVSTGNNPRPTQPTKRPSLLFI